LRGERPGSKRFGEFVESDGSSERARSSMLMPDLLTRQTPQLFRAFALPPTAPGRCAARPAGQRQKARMALALIRAFIERLLNG
jgi:hypothetical protein